MQSKLSVLIVDDEEDFLSLIADSLGKTFTTYAATTPDEALAIMKNSPPDIIVSDVNMPGKDGVELLKIIKEDNPLIPVIMLTGSSSMENVIKCLRAGAFDYIEKPFRPELVVDAIDRASIYVAQIALQNYKIDNDFMASEKERDYYIKILNFLPDFIVIYDIFSNCITEVNERVCEKLAYSKEELVHMDILNICPDITNEKNLPTELNKLVHIELEFIAKNQDKTKIKTRINKLNDKLLLLSAPLDLNNL